MTGPAAPALHLTEVHKVYADRVAALHGVSLRIEAGEMVAVVGPSGSGKSTLLHLAGALDRPTSGTVRVCGENVADLSDAELSTLRGAYIGFVFQQFHLSPHVSAEENVADGLLYLGVPRAERLARSREALERVGLGERRRHRPAELSGGERQRVAIARAFVRRPQLLLADEPTGNLDSTAGKKIMSILDDLHDAGTTVVVITHDQAIADRLPRRVSLMDGMVSDDTGTAS